MDSEELLAEIRELVVSMGGPDGSCLAVMISDILGITSEEVGESMEWEDEDE